MLSLAPACAWTFVSESQMSSWVVAIVQQLRQSHTDFPSKAYGTPHTRTHTDCVLELHLPIHKPKEDRFCVRHFQIASYGIEAQHMRIELMGLCCVLMPQAFTCILVTSHQPCVVNTTSAISAEQLRWESKFPFDIGAKGRFVSRPA